MSVKQSDRKLILFFGVLLAAIFWNYWLPAVKGYFNTVSPTFNVSNVDFYAYYRGGEAYLRGEEPYAGTRDGQLYIYPPTFVPLYGELARLDYDVARTIWAVIYTIFFLAAGGLMLWTMPEQDRWPLSGIVLFVVLVSYPLQYLIRQGQIDLIVASLCFISYLLYRQGQKTLSALFLSLATLTKLNPLFFLITFVVFFWDWKYLLRYAVCLAGIVGISALMFPLDWYRAFAMEVLPALTKSQTFYYNQTPLRFFAGDRWIPRFMTLGGIGALTLLAYFAGIRFRKAVSVANNKGSALYQADMFYFLNALVILLSSGSAWIMAYTWFILPSAPVLLYAVRRGKWWFVLGSGLAALMINGRLVSPPVLNVINMSGAILMMVLLVTAILIPHHVFEDVKRSAFD